MNRYRAFFALLVFTANTVAPLFAQNELILSGANTPDVYTARDKITLKAGFSCSLTEGQTFTASLNGHMVSPLVPIGAIDADTWTPGTDLLVGSTAYSTGVSETGGFTCQVPIYTPPGIGSMIPSISIVYNSQSGNGLLGQGWNIAGLSAITRAARDYFHDGKTQGIELDNRDAYTLDGNRLIPISGGNGEAGTLYGTENEMFAQIYSYNTLGAGPEYFQVNTKDGKTLKYGISEDSRALPGVGAVLMWRLSTATDANGNQIYYKYRDENGENVLESIHFTGNFANPSTPIWFTGSMEFLYQEREDAGLAWIKEGAKVPQRLVLRAILVKSEDQVVRRYDFSYAFMDNTSRLVKIQETGADGKKLNPLIVEWGQKGTDVTSVVLQRPDPANFPKYHIFPGDFDGDGQQDYFAAATEQAYDLPMNSEGLEVIPDPGMCYKAGGFYKAQQGSFVEMTEGLLPFQLTLTDLDIPVVERIVKIVVRDADNDGRDEVYALEIHPKDPIIPGDKDDYTWHKIDPFTFSITTVNEWPAQGSGFNELKNRGFVQGDFDGNGQPDFVGFTGDGHYDVSVNFTVDPKPDELIGSTRNRYACDFTGDGKTDLMVLNTDSYRVFQYSNGTFEQIIQGTDTRYDDRHFFGDFNGDGKTDMLIYHVTDKKWKLFFATQDGFLFGAPLTGMPFLNKDPGDELASDNYNYYVHDMNSDGRSDVVETYYDSQGVSHLVIWYSKGGYGTFSRKEITPPRPFVEGRITIGDFDGNGIQDILHSEEGNDLAMIRMGVDDQKRFVTTLADGYGALTKIQYASLSNGPAGFYTKGSGSVFPLMEFQAPLYAVQQITAPTGQLTTYAYAGARIHRQGKGFLGFRKMTTEVPATGLKTVQEASLDINTLRPAESDARTWINGEYMGGTFTDFLTTAIGTGRYFTWANTVTTIDEQNDTKNTRVANYTSQGNLTSEQTTSYYQSGSSWLIQGVSTRNCTYTQAAGHLPNRIATEETVVQYGTQPAYSRKVSYTYDSRGNAQTRTADPDSEWPETTIWEINRFGLPTRTTVSAPGMSPRMSRAEYDNNGRFALRTYNVLGQRTSAIFNITGNILSQTGPDNLTTLYTYDGFGRLRTTADPLHNETTVTYAWTTSTTADAPANARWKSTTQRPDGSYTIVFYDKHGRELRTLSNTADGLVYTDTQYDALGRAYKASEPYYKGSQPVWSETSFDVYGRAVAQNDNGLITSFAYGVRTKTITLPSGSTTTETSDALGQVISSVTNGNTVSYVYNSQGNVIESHALGTVTRTTFDALGRQTALIDPAAGTISYAYDAFGQLLSQTDARGNTTHIEYDPAGRPVRKTSPDGEIRYFYVTAYQGLGQPDSVAGPGPVAEKYRYDTYGRLISKTDWIDGEAFTTRYTYDTDLGRLQQTTYNTGFYTLYGYSATGEHTTTHTPDGTQVWKLIDANAAGQPLLIKLQTGTIEHRITYDSYHYPTEIKIGIAFHRRYGFDAQKANLTWRNDQKTLYGESFTYDTDNRLTSMTSGGYSTTAISYNAQGGIARKGDAGDYIYNAARPHALDRLENNPLSIAEPDQHIDYNADGKATLIEEGDWRLEILYGPDGQRVRSRWYRSGLLHHTVWYIGDYERHVYGADTLHYHYIAGPAGLAAINIRHGGADSLFYVCADYQGNLLALLNPQGQVVEEQDFDAWGRRRNPADHSYAVCTLPRLLTRGYTGHEHLDAFGLINMNGRLYDPVVGMFLSPDPLVCDASNPFCYNRYAYCLNNPLMYVDPSGENPAAIVFAVAGIVGGGMNLYNNWDKVDNFQDGFAYFTIGAVGGMTSVLNPAAGFGVTATCNVWYDFATGELDDIQGWDWLDYGANTILGALGVAGSGQFAKSFYANNLVKAPPPGPPPVLEPTVTSSLTDKYITQPLPDVPSVRVADELATSFADDVPVGLTKAVGEQKVWTVTYDAAKTEMTTVGRWMSEAEYNAMKSSGNVLEGAGGQTFVTQGGSNLYTGAARGSVYAEFEVPTNSLLQGGKEGWFKMLGPNASKSQLFMLNKQGGQLLPSFQNLSPILQVK